MSETLSLTQAGDQVETEVTTFNKPDGSSEQLILSFQNADLVKS